MIEAARRSGSSGTTLVEVLISIVILGFAVVTISDAYFTGLRALDAQRTEAQIDARLRSYLEILLAEDFASLSDGQVNVDIEGTFHLLEWSVTPVDLEGDLVPEVAARHITVTLRDRAIETIVVDHGGWVAKL